MNTKEHIIEAAIGLFNEQGTEALSTNHIAEALSMSPDNLYYHFRNKEEIIEIDGELVLPEVIEQGCRSTCTCCSPTSARLDRREQ